MSVRATTIPDFETDAISPAGRLPVTGSRHVFPCCQKSFLQSAVFPAAILRFCCRAAVDRPRVPFLVTMSLHNLKIRRRERTACWQFYLVPRLASLSNSGRTLGHRNSCRNLSAPSTLRAFTIPGGSIEDVGRSQLLRNRNPVPNRSMVRTWVTFRNRH